MLLVGLISPHDASGHTGSDYKAQLQQVHALLDSAHTRVTRAALIAVGPLVPAILLREALRSAATRRTRNALSLLLYFPTKGAGLLCARAERSRDLRTRRIGIRGCATTDRKVFGSVTKTLLNDGNMFVREATLLALIHLCDAPAKKALNAHHRIEKERFLREMIGRVAPPKRSESGAWRCRPATAR